MHPAVEDLPSKYRYLVDWYERDYVNGNGDKDPLAAGATIAEVLKFKGKISSSGRKKMKGIEEDFENEPLPPGGKIANLIKALRRISPGDIRKMEAAIEDACERIDANAW
ncbi:MAG TPA: hypothetical protein VKY85_07010 [Candidatus Angelobacter sp.]|nr:hypothetical protein [Candidatus Angelobacter sp.]